MSGDDTTGQPKHICVCVCTYKRPQLLKRLLQGLDRQDTGSLFTYSIVVADNDEQRSAEPVIAGFAAASKVRVKYCVQPKQNIALTRNKAIENAQGDFIAFFDDDQFPTDTWLRTLYEACAHYDVDGVLGPVKPHFDDPPPQWVIKGRFYDRPTYPTGLVIDGKKGRTGNVLLQARVFAGEAEPFRPEFLTGEDQDFFGRMIAKGFKFIWCNEAVGYEVVPPIRWKRSFMVRRALLRGKIAARHTTRGAMDTFKSVVAIPIYALALPFSIFLGQHKFMVVLVKLCDHLGKILAVLGLNPAKEAYVVE